MKIIMVSMMHDYGIKERDFSYDYYNMYDTLKKMTGVNVIFFDYMETLNEAGRGEMNIRLLALIEKEKPDLTTFSLYTDQLLPETLDKARSFTKTLCYFWDDQWRIQFALQWAPHFDYLTTPDYDGIRKWKSRGFNKVIYSPFGSNPNKWKRLDVPKKYDVSFVGMKHSYREWILRKLEKAGISVHTVGAGWPSGFVSYDEIINIFNQSRINLNLSNSISYDLRYAFSSLRAVRDVANSLRASGDVKNREQIKGRHFEIPGCGGFQLSFYVEGLEHCYDIGQEIAVYSDTDDLIEKINYYLKYEDDRERIAAAGYQRTLRDHTYEKRVKDILAYTGLMNG